MDTTTKVNTGQLLTIATALHALTPRTLQGVRAGAVSVTGAGDDVEVWVGQGLAERVTGAQHDALVALAGAGHFGEYGQPSPQLRAVLALL